VLKPIDFSGWLDGPGAGLDASQPDFWLEYWIATFEAALETAGPRATFLSYDRLCADPARGLAGLADAVGLGAASPVRDQAARLRPGAPRFGEGLVAEPARMRRAEAVHSTLLDRSIL
jgi:hypothetical protein